jgi:hypothetical protein
MAKKLTDTQKKIKLHNLAERESCDKAIISHYTSITRNYKDTSARIAKDIEDLRKRQITLDHDVLHAPEKIQMAEQDIKHIAKERAGVKDTMGRLQKYLQIKQQLRRLGVRVK